MINLINNIILQININITLNFICRLHYIHNTVLYNNVDIFSIMLSD